MNRSNQRKSDYFPNPASNAQPSLFPAGLLMYDLPSSRRTAARISTNTEAISQRTPSPDLSSSSSASSIAADDLSIDDDPEPVNLTTTEDWWRQAIEPVPPKPISTSLSAFSMADDDASNDTNPLFSLLPSFNSIEKIIVHNRPLTALAEIYTDKAADCVAQWYRSHSVPNLATLIKRGLLKIYREKSIRMTVGNKKKNIFGQLDKNGQILCTADNRLFDSVELFYQAYQPHRKRNDTLAVVYESVRWYEQPFHTVLLEYAETIVKMPGMKTRLITDDELFPRNAPIDLLPKELLCQINCWTEDRNEIEL